MVIDIQFEEAHPFSEGLAAAGDAMNVGFIDTEGNFVINRQFHFTEPFRHGRAFYQIGTIFADGSYYDMIKDVGYIDRGGNVIISQHVDYNTIGR